MTLGAQRNRTVIQDMATVNSVFTLTSQLLEVCHRLYEKGFVAGTDGNVSARIDERRILCTPSGYNKGDLSRDDFVVINYDGIMEQGNSKPSTELQMHLLYYRQRSDISAVVHAHPPYCTGFATSGQDLTGCVLPEIVVSLGGIPLAPYATPSTAEVPDSISPYVPLHDVILLQNHGVVAAGKDPLQTYYKLEKTEHAAHILYIARVLGGENRLTSTQVERLRNVAQSSYGLSPSKTATCSTAEAHKVTPQEQIPQFNPEVKDSISRAINELGL